MVRRLTLTSWLPSRHTHPRARSVSALALCVVRPTRRPCRISLRPRASSPCPSHRHPWVHLERWTFPSSAQHLLPRLRKLHRHTLTRSRLHSTRQLVPSRCFRSRHHKLERRVSALLQGARLVPLAPVPARNLFTPYTRPSLHTLFTRVRVPRRRRCHRLLRERVQKRSRFAPSSCR